MAGNLEDILSARITTECEDAHRFFMSEILRSANSMHLPDGLIVKLESFLKEQKHLFFRGFKDRMRLTIEAEIDRSLRSFSINRLASVESANEITIPLGVNKAEELKNRLWLESFFRNNMNARKAAFAVGAPKSTFHDWLKKNAELIESEGRKTDSSFRFNFTQVEG